MLRPRLVVALHLVYLLSLLTNPFVLQPPGPAPLVSTAWSWTDGPANLVLFIPLGLALRCARVPRRPAALVAILTSGALELLQLFTPRTTSPVDLAMNSAGGLVGTLWPPLRPDTEARALALLPAVWSIGLLYPRLFEGPALVAQSSLLLAAGALLSGHGRRATLERLGYLGLAVAPLASNSLGAALLVFLVGAFSAFGARTSTVVRGRTVMLAGGVAAAAMLAANPPWAWPLDVWAGHTAIFTGALGAGIGLAAPAARAKPQ